MVNIRAPSVYKHFKNREAIIEHIAKEFMVHLMDQLQLDLSLPVEESLRQSLDELVELLASRPAWGRLFLYDFSVPSGLDFITKIVGPMEGQFDVGLLSGIKARLNLWLKKGEKESGFRPTDADWLLNIIFGALTFNLFWTNRPIRAEALETTEIRDLQDNLFELVIGYLKR